MISFVSFTMTLIYICIDLKPFPFSSIRKGSDEKGKVGIQLEQTTITT